KKTILQVYVREDSSLVRLKMLLNRLLWPVRLGVLSVTLQTPVSDCLQPPTSESEQVPLAQPSLPSSEPLEPKNSTSSQVVSQFVTKSRNLSTKEKSRRPVTNTLCITLPIFNT